LHVYDYQHFLLVYFVDRASRYNFC